MIRSFEEIQRKAVNERIPIGLGIEITERCNLRCLHCYVPLTKRSKNTKKELTYKQFCNILDQASEEGAFLLLFTGGEPFLRRDFLDIYAYAKAEGFVISIFTNATLITPEIADFLRKWPPKMVDVSVYGASKETYEKVTGIRNSFNECMNGLRLLKDRKVRFSIKTVVMNVNQHELKEIEKLAEQLDVRFRYDPIIVPRLNGDKSVWDFRIPMKDIIKLDIEDKARFKALLTRKEHINVILRRFDFSKYQPPDSMWNCLAGISFAQVDSFGQLLPCVMLREPTYDLLQGTFQEGWQFMLNIRQRAPKELKRCKDCPIAHLCPKCPAHAYMGPEVMEYLCQIAKLRAGIFEE